MVKDYNYYKSKKRKGRQFFDTHTVDKIINHVISALNSDVTIDEIKGAKRHRRLTEIRLSVYWICYNVYDMQTTYTGNLLNRDHSTVIHGRDKVDDWYYIDKEFRYKFDNLILKKFEDSKNR